MNNQKKILVASENLSFLNELNSLLMENQFQISPIKLKGSQLIATLKVDPPDLTILDTPDISDTEIKQLIDIRHALDIPVILLDSRKIQQKSVEVVRFDEKSSFIQSLPLDNLITQIEGILDS